LPYRQGKEETTIAMTMMAEGLAVVVVVAVMSVATVRAAAAVVVAVEVLPLHTVADRRTRENPPGRCPTWWIRGMHPVAQHCFTPRCTIA
jgi:hypothetical protein